VFSKGRDFATWFELLLRQISIGDPTALGKLSRCSPVFCRGLREDETRCRIVFRRLLNFDPNGPFEACPLMGTQAR
jgi:hypothetical protein